MQGKIESLYYAFGDRDLVGILDFPTPEEAGAFALAVTAGGALRSFRTTPLLTVDQGLTMMQRAGEVRAKCTPPLTISLVEQKAKAR